ncbi:hypothetical protein F5144DRAFT_245463 [Chaetomium tenue]|uniref:Uncharacterized protein n=1 Tax=Chaetomium tenue TaxID=1854479 RepID=A0ACB7P7P3_9PEZI|nr:hypothetical protein F5144DRAFT_245463 [Chaetomium globosum]
MYPAIPGQPRGRSRRHGSALRDDPVTEAAATAPIHSSSRRNHARFRPNSPSPSDVGPSKRAVAAPAPELSSGQEPRGHNEAQGTDRHTIVPRNDRQLAGFVGVFPAAVLAILFAVLCASFLLAPAPDSISGLGPDKVAIKAAPSPADDLAMVSDLYANASTAINIPRHNLNITLALDAPGLIRINATSWLPETTLYFERNLSKDQIRREEGKRLPAEYAPFIVDFLNTTMTLEMANTLWPVAIHAATDLLAAGLGRQHPDYPALRAPLFRLREGNGRDILTDARRLWGVLRTQASSWPYRAQRDDLIGWLEAVARTTKSRTAAQNVSRSGNPPQLTIGAQVPTFQQLLERDGGRQQALSKLLAGIGLSEDAFSQLKEIHAALSRHRKDGALDIGVGMSTLYQTFPGLCWGQNARDLLHAVAESRCSGNYTSKKRRYPISPYGWGDYQALGGVWDAVCDTNALLSDVQALAEGVRDRVRAAVAERGGISLLERISGYISKHSIVRRMETLDRALHTLHSLRLGLRPQTWMLANMASNMLRACVLQDELRQRVRALQRSQSAWWDLEWDDARETVNLTVVTFPPANETARQLRAAMQRIIDRRDPLVGNWVTGSAATALEELVLPGWIDRLGLGGLPLEPRKADAEFDYPPHARWANMSASLKPRSKKPKTGTMEEPTGKSV